MENNMISISVNGKVFECEKGTNAGEFLRDKQILPMPCGAHGKCGKCKISVKGELSPLSENEKRLLTENEIKNNIRLACCTKIFGDSVITTEISKSSVIKTNGDLPEFEISPIFKKYGAVIDIGTTTLAASLYSKSGELLSTAGAMNPQSSFGADVISRIESQLKGKSKEIQNITVKALDKLVSELCENAKISSNDIDCTVITGNTVMLYLLTGTSTEPLSHAPFNTPERFDKFTDSKNLGFELLDCPIYFPSCVGAFIGADTVCAVLASEMTDKKETELLVDIGTNGEMALFKDGKLTFCSTAAGPAFEGAGITFGMWGKEGAIDKVTLNGDELVAHVIGDIAPTGICGSGIIDAVACLLENETLDETGFLEDGDAEILSPVLLTQEDIRKIQLAKSAICAGIITLLKSSKISYKEVNDLFIAGGFGSYLDKSSAGKIGLLPEELVPKVKVMGNAALSGGAMLLLNSDFRTKCRNFVADGEILELSSNKVFADEYMNGMLFEI